MEIIPQKFCPRCKQHFPATLAYFHADKKTRDGFYGWCKKCKRPPKISDEPEGYKRCHDCKQIKPATLEHFHAFKRNKGGFRHDCKECRKKQGAEYNSKPEIKSITSLRGKERYKQNRERIRKYGKSYRETYKDRRKIINRTYLQSKNGKASRHGIDNRRRARKKSVPGTHTTSDIMMLYKNQKGKCYYCNIKLGDHYHVDHIIPLSREGSSNDVSNLAVTCVTCNTKKGSKCPWEWSEGGRLL